MEEEIKTEKKVHGYITKRNFFQKLKDFNFHSFFATTSYGRNLTFAAIIILAIVAVTVSLVLPSFNTTNQQHASVASCLDECNARCNNTAYSCQGTCNGNYSSCSTGCALNQQSCNTTCTNNHNNCLSSSSSQLSSCQAVCYKLQRGIRQDCMDSCQAEYEDRNGTCNGNYSLCSTGCARNRQSCNNNCDSTHNNCLGTCNNNNHNCQVNCALVTCSATPTPTPRPANNSDCNKYAIGQKYEGGACTATGTCRAEGGTILGSQSCYSGGSGPLTCCGFKNPTPTPVPPTPNPIPCKNAGGFCTAPGICRGEQGVIKDISPSCQQSGYPAGSVCCAEAPPTPTMPPSCSNLGGVCVPPNTFDATHPPALVCLGKITNDSSSQAFQTQDCAAKGQFCCTGPYATPTPVQLPGGDTCIGSNSNGQIETGICFYQASDQKHYSKAQLQANACDGTGNECDGLPSGWRPTCSAAVSFYKNTSVPAHGISDNIKGCVANTGKGIQCCALTKVGPTPGVIDQAIQAHGAIQCGPAAGIKKAGVCVFDNGGDGTSLPITTDNWAVGGGNISACSSLQPNARDVTSSPSECFALGTGLGSPYRCCAINYTPQYTCTSNGGVCANNYGTTPPDSTHTYKNSSYTCPSGACWTKCPQGTSCSGGKSTPTPTNGGGGNGGGDGGGGGGDSCKNGQTTAFTINVKLPGIGQGDFDNPHPKHNSRAVKLEVVDLNNDKAVKIKPREGTYSLNSDGTITFSNVLLGTSALGCSGKYKVRVTVPGNLKVLSDQEVQYGKDASTNKLTATLLPGDIVDASSHKVGSDNHITIEDYNLLSECRNQTSVTVNDFGTNATVDCTSVANLLDYSDGGMTGDEWAANYNTLLRSWIQSGGNGQ